MWRYVLKIYNCSNDPEAIKNVTEDDLIKVIEFDYPRNNEEFYEIKALLSEYEDYYCKMYKEQFDIIRSMSEEDEKMELVHDGLFSLEDFQNELMIILDSEDNNRVDSNTDIETDVEIIEDEPDLNNE